MAVAREQRASVQVVGVKRLPIAWADLVSIRCQCRRGNTKELTKPGLPTLQGEGRACCNARLILPRERGEFTKRTARLRKDKTSEANQHRTKVHYKYNLDTETTPNTAV
jgi:hypothetical protein